MITRIGFICAAALICSAESASAQGQPQKQVAVSNAILKTMVANKPKSKAPLGAKVGMLKRKSVVAPKPRTAARTSVREVARKN